MTNNPISPPPDSRTAFDAVPWQQFFYKLWQRVTGSPQTGATGSFSLSGGVATVPAVIAATDLVFFTLKTGVNPGFLRVSAVSPSSFTVTSSSSTDASTVSWLQITP